MFWAWTVYKFPTVNTRLAEIEKSYRQLRSALRNVCSALRNLSRAIENGDLHAVRDVSKQLQVQAEHAEKLLR